MARFVSLLLDVVKSKKRGKKKDFNLWRPVCSLLASICLLVRESELQSDMPGDFLSTLIVVQQSAPEDN